MAKSLAKQELFAVHSSGLQRALLTAEAILREQNGSISVQVSSLLEEQNFGAGENRLIGKLDKSMTMAAHYARGIFPAIYTRKERFPGGECSEDVAQRAKEAFEDIMRPYLVVGEAEKREYGKVVAIVSHRIFLAELLTVIVANGVLRKDAATFNGGRGMRNTGITRVKITTEVRPLNCVVEH